jgi:Ca2+-binding EF-hand superfamily protein
MKSKLLLASLICTSFAAMQQASFADNHWFDRCDRDGDGRWNYNEYSNSERLWIKEHPDAARVSERDMQRDFEKYDSDRDGFVKVEEVREHHPW